MKNLISKTNVKRSLMCFAVGSLLAACGGAGDQSASSSSQAKLLVDPASVKINIAAANVTASSTDAANIPANAVDGNLGTHWTGAAASGTQWIQFNLGGCYTTDFINISWYQGDARQYNFTVQASADGGSTWTTVKTATSAGTSAALVQTDFPNTVANVMRLSSTGNSVNTKVSVNDVEFWGKAGGTCSGSATTTTTKAGTTTTTTKATTTTTQAPAANFIYSPYKYSGVGNGNNQMNTAVTGSQQTLLAAMPSSLKAITWAFATGSCGSENWSGVSPSAFAAANVQSFVNAGKKYIVATGGGGATFTCTSDANFLKFIKTYYSANMLGVDFDIESGQSQSDIDNLVTRVVNAQSTYPNLRYSFTIATEGGNTAESLGGPTSTGGRIVNSIKAHGLTNYTINLMVMDFADTNGASADLCTLNSSGKCDMGKSANNAAISLHNYYGIPYSKIELTPMIGANDSPDEIFSLTDVTTMSNFVLTNKLAGVHFWAFDRDRDCAPISDGSSDTCNTWGKQGAPLSFTNKFLTALGL